MAPTRDASRSATSASSETATRVWSSSAMPLVELAHCGCGRPVAGVVEHVRARVQRLAGGGAQSPALGGHDSGASAHALATVVVSHSSSSTSRTSRRLPVDNATGRDAVARNAARRFCQPVVIATSGSPPGQIRRRSSIRPSAAHISAVRLPQLVLVVGRPDEHRHGYGERHGDGPAEQPVRQVGGRTGQHHRQDERQQRGPAGGGDHRADDAGVQHEEAHHGHRHDGEPVRMSSERAERDQHRRRRPEQHVRAEARRSGRRGSRRTAAARTSRTRRTSPSARCRSTSEPMAKLAGTTTAARSALRTG